MIINDSGLSRLSGVVLLISSKQLRSSCCFHLVATSFHEMEMLHASHPSSSSSSSFSSPFSSAAFIEEDEDRGRFVKSSRELRKGELVLHSEAYAWAVYDRFKTKFCHWCMDNNSDSKKYRFACKECNQASSKALYYNC